MDGKVHRFRGKKNGFVGGNSVTAKEKGNWFYVRKGKAPCFTGEAKNSCGASQTQEALL